MKQLHNEYSSPEMEIVSCAEDVVRTSTFTVEDQEWADRPSFATGGGF